MRRIGAKTKSTKDLYREKPQKFTVSKMKLEKANGKLQRVAFHKGALTTLISERRELVRLVTAVNSLMMSHIEALRELGVDLKKEARIAK